MPVCLKTQGILAGDPFGPAKSHRIEQGGAGVIGQRSACSPGDETAEQRRCATAVLPTLARRADHRPLQHEAVAIPGHLHADLIIGRAVIGEADFVPLRTKRHRQRMRDGLLLAALVRRDEVLVFGKLCIERRVRRRDFSLGQGDAVEQRDDALRRRVKVVQGVGPELHDAQPLAPVVVIGFEITFQHDVSAAHDQNAMQAPGALLHNELIEARLDI